MTAHRQASGTPRAQIRLALVAPSGSGKSTVAGLLREAFGAMGLSVEVIKLAAPLYRLQERYYQEACCALAAGSQDQLLLEQIATSLRKINASSLVQNFRARLSVSTADVVINDDLRDDITDWPALREDGFSVLRIQADVECRDHRLALRNDRNSRARSPLDVQIARIPASEVLVNEGTLEDLRASVSAFVRRFAAARAELGSMGESSHVVS